jgi:hypothetical protein
MVQKLLKQVFNKTLDTTEFYAAEFLIGGFVVLFSIGVFTLGFYLGRQF